MYVCDIGTACITTELLGDTWSRIRALNSLQFCCNNICGTAGDMAALSAHVEGLSSRLTNTTDNLKDLSNNSIKRFEDQASSIMRLTAVSVFITKAVIIVYAV